MAMMPTIPATPSVALSKNDRRFIQARRELKQAQRIRRLRTLTERVLIGAVALIWANNLILIIGG